MTQTTPNPPPSRAHVSPPSCPLCLGAGTLPSMTTAWVRLRCPRCEGASRSPQVAPAHGGRIMTLGEVAEAESVPAAVDRRQAADSADLSRWAAALLFLAGGACGLVFGVLVAGIFRMFGS